MLNKILKGAVSSLFVAILTFGVALILSGCGDDTLVNGGGDDDTTTYDASLHITRYMEDVGDSVGYGDYVIVSGWVVDSNGTGVANVQVFLYAVPLDMGYFDKSIDTTRIDGSFSAKFWPLDTGEVALWTQVAGNTLNQKSKTVTVSQGTGPINGGDDGFHVDYDVPEGFILANGHEEVQISAVVYVDEDTPAPNGTVIRLEAGEQFTDNNGDGYFTENIDDVKYDANDNGIWDKIGTVPSAVTTDDSLATFTYTAGTRAGFVFIRATYGPASDPSYSELVLTLRPSSEVAYIRLSAQNPKMQVKSTGGIESSNLTAFCYDKYGNPVQQDIEVQFRIISGPDGGENIEHHGDGPVTALTNVAGAATVTVLSGIISGTVATQASVDTVYSDVTLLNINAGPPRDISVGVSPCNILGCGYVGARASVTALVKDIYSNPVMDSTAVYFTVDSTQTPCIGMVEASGLTYNGMASSNFYSSGNCFPHGALIVAETDGGRIADTTLLWVSGIPAQVTIYSYPTSLYADGKDYGKVYVRILDAMGIYVLDGTEFDLEFWPEGTVSGGSTSDGCHTSVGVSKLTSQVLSKDYSYTVPDDGIGAVGRLTATAGAGAGVSNSVYVNLLTGASHKEKSEIQIVSKVAPGSSEPVVVVIKDRAGNPLGGHLLVATASLGTITTDGILTDLDSVYTNNYGEAVGLTYIAPAGLGNAYITVSDLDPVYGGLVVTQKIKIEFDE